MESDDDRPAVGLGGGVRLDWIGHSTVLIGMDGLRLLTDPVVRSRVAHLRRVVPEPALEPLAAVDAVLVSHVHYDHVDLASLRRIGRTTPIVAPRGTAAWLAGRGFHDVAELDPGGEERFGPVTVTATHAEHHGTRGPLGVTAPSLGYRVAGSAAVYFAGDTDLFDGMRELAPGLDVALLPVAGWGGRLPAGHLDAAGAARALTLLRPRVAVPIHWGTYCRIGLDRDSARLRKPADEFARVAADVAPGVDVRVLPVGGGLDVPAREPHASATGAL